jgi:hypothetical protein
VINSIVKRSNHFLFTATDELAFSEGIRREFPSAMFIDDMIWETDKPPAKDSITACESKFVYIWDPTIYPVLPFESRPDGRFQGPQAGMVIQVIRSRFKDPNTLLSGEIDVGITVDRPGASEMKQFAREVWKILQKVTPRKPVQVNPSTLEVMFPRKDILLGNDAAEWCLASNDRFLKFNNNRLIFLRPAE